LLHAQPRRDRQRAFAPARRLWQPGAAAPALTDPKDILTKTILSLKDVRPSS